MELVTDRSESLFGDVKTLILEAKQRAFVRVNAELTLLNWRIGHTIRTEILREQRAEYGEAIVKNLSEKLTHEFGKGFGFAHLRYCMRFAEVIQDEQIVHTLYEQLSWSHFKEIIYLKDALQRAFYLELCSMEGWTVRVLRDRITSMLYERTALSKKPDELILQELETLRKTQIPSADIVFRDTYVLDFLGLRDTYSEKDLEQAILNDLERVILELGQDFAFMARQKRLTIDNEDYHLDLLFYHRRMRRLVVIELKLDKFRPEHEGQMKLYLRWLKRHEMLEGENAPIGLILCAEATGERVELMLLDEPDIRIAQYLTELPPKELWETKLHQAVETAKRRLERNA